MSYILQESFGDGNTGGDNFNIYSTRKGAQTFVASANYSVTKVSIQINQQGSPTGNVTVGIYTTDGSHNPTGSALVSNTIDITTLPTSFNHGGFVDILLAATPLTSGTEYAIQVSYTGGDVSNYCAFMGQAVNTSRYWDEYTGSWANKQTSTHDFKVWSSPTGSMLNFF